MKSISKYEESMLLSRVAKGEEDAFRILFTEYRHQVYQIARKLLQSETKAEDALQEIFLKIWLNREKLPEIQSFSAWLNTITRNYLYNALRSLAYEEVFLQQSAQSGHSFDGREDILSPLALQELKELLQKIVGTLTPQQRRVFELSRMEGLRHEEIAALLDISRETVKKHLGEALRIVREKMAGYRNPAGRLPTTGRPII
ncbi:MAG TPA: RNA polymerase sigma-70 factor [Puia sp.]|nr:RNA polymerase sigma-70 factor [Puia sp.]